jgi:ureidoglycolate lyase
VIEKSRSLSPTALTRAAFAPFGDVIELAGAERFAINGGTTTRFHDLAHIDTAAEGGRPLLSLFRAQPTPRPFRVRLMERHPLGSQAFVPLLPRPFLVLVAPPGPPPDPSSLVLFLTGGFQGVNYARGVWHHPLLALDAESDFLVVDRGGPGQNCDEHHYPDDIEVIVS